MKNRVTTICLTKTGNTYKFKAEGHAGFNPGNDIVCASVCILTYALAGRLQELGCNISDNDIISGYAAFSFPVNNLTVQAVKTTFCGFRMLQKSFPDNVRIVDYE